jgi:tRNA pseudouridine38-40 synthase
MLRQFAITIAYDGTRYGGWQIQPNAKTVQQVLVDAIEQATSERVHVQGSGRTDSGVHAVGQIGSFRLQDWNPGPDRLIPAINRYLPTDIVIRDCREVVTTFDPIRQAINKRYRYKIRNSRVPDVMGYRYHWWIPKPLDIDKMQQASLHLIGQHDFKSFETLGSPRKSTVRHVQVLTIQPVEVMDGLELWVDIQADGFLYNMVRNVVGALWTVGSGRFEPDWIAEFRDRRERDTSSHTAPPQGLCLQQVNYPAELFLAHPPSI